MDSNEPIISLGDLSPQFTEHSIEMQLFVRLCYASCPFSIEYNAVLCHNMEQALCNIWGFTIALGLEGI